MCVVCTHTLHGIFIFKNTDTKSLLFLIAAFYDNLFLLLLDDVSSLVCLVICQQDHVKSPEWRWMWGVEVGGDH